MNELDEREELIKLYDIYEGLLTDKQRQYFEAYYFDDFSLAEIADNFDVSRNAVFDQIKKTVANLKKYENFLHIATNNDILEKTLSLTDINEIKKLITKIIEE